MEMPAEPPSRSRRAADYVPPKNWADPEEVIAEGRAFIRALSRADKIAFFSAVGAMLTCVLPWKETSTEGEIIGLVCMGLITFLAALACAIAVIFRVRDVLPRTNPLFLWLTQMLAAATATLWSLVFIPMSYDGKMVTSSIGNLQVALSRPSYGAVFGVVLSGVAAGGTLMSLKERR